MHAPAFDFILAHEAAFRLAVFLGLLALLLVLEALAPRRRGARLRQLRWSANLPMAIAGALAVRVLLPLGAVGAAFWARAHDVGLFNLAPVPSFVAGAISFLALDALIYWQHRLLHAIGPLWRLHRMHHTDIEFDATTALRFHPGEIVLSMLLKIAAVLALGAPALSVVAFEAALNGAAMFNHSNVALPPALDRALRWLVITPDMHRVHHSVHAREFNRNFGFSFSFWDRLFGSYTAQPADGHEAMRIGLAEFRERDEQGLVALLKQPLTSLR